MRNRRRAAWLLVAVISLGGCRSSGKRAFGVIVVGGAVVSMAAGAVSHAIGKAIEKRDDPEPEAAPNETDKAIERKWKEARRNRKR